MALFHVCLVGSSTWVLDFQPPTRSKLAKNKERSSCFDYPNFFFFLVQQQLCIKNKSCVHFRECTIKRTKTSFDSWNCVLVLYGQTPSLFIVMTKKNKEFKSRFSFIKTFLENFNYLLLQKNFWFTTCVSTLLLIKLKMTSDVFSGFLILQLLLNL